MPSSHFFNHQLPPPLISNQLDNNMVSSAIHSLILFCSLVIFHTITTPSLAKPSFRPKALVLPVSKDASTLQYLTTINQRTPLVPVKLTLDLGGDFLWVDCEQDFISSTYRPSRCHSSQCSLANAKNCFDCLSPQRPGCHNNTCELMPSNTVLGTGGNFNQLGQDHVSLQSTDGSNPGRLVSVPNFLFICGQTFLLTQLATGVKGIAGLGRGRIGLPSQLASAFSFKIKFAICLSSSTSSNGAVLFGDGPYILLPGIDVSKSLVYTPLHLNPFSTAPGYVADPSAEYFINVKSIKINGKTVSFNTSLLSFDQYGYGGTKISTVNPYTVLENTIYNAFVDAFVKEFPAHVPRVAAVEPFGACFNSTHIRKTRVSSAVPNVDFVLQSESVYWRMLGKNSMVQVSKDVLCLGFVDAGLSPSNPRTAIVIGGHQLEENFLQFDLAASRLGFSSLISSGQTTCANFNFTSNA